MFRFLVGMAIGAFGAYYVQQRPQREQLEAKMHELQERTNAVMGESRRILDEARGELTAALEAGRESAQRKADRLRSAAMMERQAGGGPPV